MRGGPASHIDQGRRSRFPARVLLGEGYFRYARAPSHQALSDTATKFNMAPDKEWSF